MIRMRRISTVAAILAVFLLAAGCGNDGKLRTRGRVVRGGQPVVMGEGEFVRVTFIPLLDDGKTAEDFYYAEFNPADGSFQVSGKDRTGMPPGKYRIAVEHMKNRQDLFRGKYSGPDSPVIRDVKSMADEVVIDLADLK
jgi:hypothetical protein